jgi:undecaprenyl-diphosphatase
MEYLLKLDQNVFLFVNHLPHPWVINEFAKFFSGIGAWGGIWFVIAIILFFREERRDHWFFIPVLFASGIGLLLSEYILKYIFARPRPLLDMGAIIIQSASNYSFPSTHATLSYALATVLVAEEPALHKWLYLLAFFISLSRMYLGVHYAIDVAVGAVLGGIVGHGAVFLSKRLHDIFSPKRPRIVRRRR